MSNRSPDAGLFTSVHLTLVSVLQAIALESLVDQQSAMGYTFDLGGLVLILQSAFALHVIFNIWISYALVVLPMRWTFDFTDFAFPFLIAVLEYAAIKTLGSWDSRILFAVVFVGYISGWFHVTHNIKRARAQDPGDASFGFPLASLRRPYVELALIGLIALLAILLIPQWSNDWICCVALLLLHCSLVRSTVAWLRWWKSFSCVR